MMIWIKKLINKPWWKFLIGVCAIFTFFGITGGDLINKMMDYGWIFNATKWSLILGSFLFAVHAYIRAERNRKSLINIKTSTYDEAYKKFADVLSFAIGRYRGYSSGSRPKEERKYTEIGVMEMINQVKSAKLQLLSVCGNHVRSIILGADNDWLDDINCFGKTAHLIEQKLSEAAFKDRD